MSTNRDTTPLTLIGATLVLGAAVAVAGGQGRTTHASAGTAGGGARLAAAPTHSTVAPPSATPPREPRVFVTGPSELAQARRATARFRSVGRAVRAGYTLPSAGPLHQCITDYANTGAMGFHFVNEDEVADPAVDAARPEVLVYHRDDRGRVRLGALEHVVLADDWDRDHTSPPRVHGREMMRVESPNRYEMPAFYMLHVWLWRHNPAGLFTAYNPVVSCHADEPPTVAEPRSPAPGPDRLPGAGHRPV